METDVERYWYIIVKNVPKNNGLKEEIEAFYMSESEINEYKHSYACISITKTPFRYIVVFNKFTPFKNNRYVEKQIKEIMEKEAPT